MKHFCIATILVLLFSCGENPHSTPKQNLNKTAPSDTAQIQTSVKSQDSHERSADIDYYLSQLRNGGKLGLHERDAYFATLTRNVISNCSSDDIERYLGEIQFGAAYGGALRSAVLHFADNDVRRAFNLLNKEEASIYSTAAANALGRLIQPTPEVVAMISKLKPSVRCALIDALAAKSGEVGISTAVAFIDQYPGLFPNRIQAIQRLIKNIGESRPEEASGFITGFSG